MIMRPAGLLKINLGENVNKKIAMAVSLLVIATACLAQSKPPAKTDRPVKQEQLKEEPIKPFLAPKGPVGFGALKMGMTKEAIEALQPTEDLYLTAPMTPYHSKFYTPKDGIDKFDATLIAPFSAKSLKAVLTFQSGGLTEATIFLDESSGMLNRIKGQIAEKYGPGKIEDNRKDEQCIYKNGSNFKISSGTINTKWVAELTATERIETNLGDLSLEHCPSSLRDVRTGPIVVHGLTMQRFDSKSEVKPRNPF